DDFDALDTAIRRAIRGFVDVGRYLAEVRDRRLYREQFATFEAYVAGLGLKRQRAYELIDAAGVAESVSEISDIKIERESHAAALADVPADKRAEVLKVASKTSGGKITAKAINKAKKAIVEPDDDEDDLSWRNDHVKDFVEEPIRLSPQRRWAAQAG